jgi:hypothetical protein
MSEEVYCCEYCGYGSSSKERCTHCGRDIADLFTHPAGFRPLVWGKMTVHLLEPADAEHVWKEIAEEWSHREQNTNLGMLISQMDKFNTRADVLELYGSDSEASAIKKILHGRGTIDFEELPHDQIPRPPPPPRPAHWREPYVPRRKR